MAQSTSADSALNNCFLIVASRLFYSDPHREAWVRLHRAKDPLDLDEVYISYSGQRGKSSEKLQVNCYLGCVSVPSSYAK